ncbi:hypothetical protein [Acinetobacter sp.]|uniref:hypothetical protein n=1 Tax=Acinetobacter sp. TaxID=472 RepID=UPI003D089241
MEEISVKINLTAKFKDEQEAREFMKEFYALVPDEMEGTVHVVEKGGMRQKLADALDEFLLESIGNPEEIKDVEHNCGTMWITRDDDKVFAISSMETESDDE